MDILNALSNISVISNLNLNLSDIAISIILIEALVVGIKLIINSVKKRFNLNSIRINQVTFNIGVGSVTISSNKEVAKIAHKAYIEIITRKVRIEI